MCGIFVHISHQDSNTLPPTLVVNLKSRGPDSYEVRHVTVGTDEHELVNNEKPVTWHLTIASSVLALRGDQVQPQPFLDEDTGSIFCWNGEAWKLGDDVVHGNDGSEIFKRLLEPSVTPEEKTGQIVDLFESVQGPYAFVYYDAVNLTLYYGRDRFGRRSLLSHSANLDKELILSSVAMTESKLELKEVEATNGIHVVNLRSMPLQISTFPPVRATLNDKAPSSDDIPSTPSDGAVDKLQQQLFASLRLRATDIPTHTYRESEAGASKVGVLFSGGLDCTLLARLMHDLLPASKPIDLLNVAFENPRIVASLPDSNLSPYELCPDRITGISSFHELCRTCPTRTWNFIAIDIPYAESQAHRQMIISLMVPHNTEMDLSIAMALYFAARGSGTLTPHCSSSPTPTSRLYQTPARVLLSGLGADELFAGYTRHATSFARAGYPGLIAELALDWERIGTRNLGRDDRVTSHWGREIRYPYLDEDFVEVVLGMEVWEKCGFRTEKSGGDWERKDEQQELLDPAKMALRLMAWRLDMKKVAAEKKRAIQFGSRTAKMGTGKAKGTDAVV